MKNLDSVGIGFNKQIPYDLINFQTLDKNFHQITELHLDYTFGSEIMYFIQFIDSSSDLWRINELYLERCNSFLSYNDYIIVNHAMPFLQRLYLEIDDTSANEYFVEQITKLFDGIIHLRIIRIEK